MDNLFNVHKDFAQESGEKIIWGHEQFLGLKEEEAKAKYHELLSYAYKASDAYVDVFVMRTDGIHVLGEVIDRMHASPVVQDGQDGEGVE